LKQIPKSKHTAANASGGRYQGRAARRTTEEEIKQPALHCVTVAERTVLVAVSSFYCSASSRPGKGNKIEMSDDDGERPDGGGNTKSANSRLRRLSKGDQRKEKPQHRIPPP